MWPYFEGVHDVNNPPKIPSAAMDRFASVPGIFIAGCANDETIPIAMGRQGGPPCIVLRLDDQHEVMCGFASDAIFERLKAAGHENPVMYKRVDTCGAPFMPTDTGPALANWYNPLQAGHDSWNKIYASAEFTDWLSVQTLNGEELSCGRWNASRVEKTLACKKKGKRGGAHSGGVTAKLFTSTISPVCPI